MTDIAQIAAGLSEGRIGALKVTFNAWGLPPGHNAWPLVEYEDACGDDVDWLLRAGLLDALIPDDTSGAVFLSGDGDDVPDVYAKWLINPSPLGLAVREYLISTPPQRGKEGV